MGVEEPESPPSGGKYWKSPSIEDGSEEASKRRKYHRHRHHRRHGKHAREEEGNVNVDLPFMEKTDAEVEVASLSKPPDDELEEGEILEEEDEGGYLGAGIDTVLAKGRDSDVESGEICTEAIDAHTNLGTFTEDGTYLVESVKVLNHIENASPFRSLSVKAQKLVNLDYSNLLNDCTSEKGDDVPIPVEDLKLVNQRDASKNYETMEEELDGDVNVSEAGSLVLKDKENGIELARQSGHRAKKRTEKDKRCQDVDDLGNRHRSSCPVSVQWRHLGKHRRAEDQVSRDSDLNLERHESERLFETWDGKSRPSDNKNQSISLKSSRDWYGDTRRSPEPYHRYRSRSRENKMERLQEMDLEPNADASTRINHFDLQVCTRSDSDHEQGVRHDKVDCYSLSSRDGDKVNHREKESISSYSRHEVREDRCGSRDRFREREKYNGDRGRDSVDAEKGVRGERGRSSSYSRHDGKEERHGCRDRDRGRERYSSSGRDINREKPRGTSRERNSEKERQRDASRENSEKERQRDANREKEHVKDGNSRSRPSDIEYRERGGYLERNRITTQDRNRESRQSKNETEHHRKRTRLEDKEATSDRHNAEGNKKDTVREENEEVYKEKIEQQLAKQDEDDVEKIKEESRKRRQAILEKHKQQQMQQQVKSPKNQEKVDPASNDRGDLQERAGGAVSNILDEEPQIRLDHIDPSFTLGKSPSQNGEPSTQRTVGASGLGEGSPKSERSADMFCDDIFGESPAGVRKLGKQDGPQIDRSGLNDNWDDAEGYYSYRFGEVLDGRFEVIAAHGKGVFSTVVRAKDLKAGKDDPEEVAIKIIRNNDTMYKAGLEELVILKKLVGADPEDKRHCVRFLSSFKYRNHLCLVFESLHMNLREVLKKFGRNIGLRLSAVRTYAKQLFIALKHLRNCGVLHCDIKPDNMLVNEAKNVLKLCDFGNAMFAGKNEITPYLVSRFYRAPEIILGLPYDHPLDIWSVGCCLYELYTGKVLFPGPSNNDMLRLHMELKGPFPKKMLRKGAFMDHHFDQDLNFHATEEDLVTKKTVMRLLLNIKPKDIGTFISSYPGEDPKMLANFKDLLERIFILDPEKRMTVSQALSHPFMRAS